VYRKPLTEQRFFGAGSECGILLGVRD
jgi:hypothetical protein